MPFTVLMHCKQEGVLLSEDSALVGQGTFEEHIGAHNLPGGIHKAYSLCHLYIAELTHRGGSSYTADL